MDTTEEAYMLYPASRIMAQQMSGKEMKKTKTKR